MITKWLGMDWIISGFLPRGPKVFINTLGPVLVNTKLSVRCVSGILRTAWKSSSLRVCGNLRPFFLCSLLAWCINTRATWPQTRNLNDHNRFLTADQIPSRMCHWSAYNFYHLKSSHYEYKNCDLSGSDVVAWHRDINVSEESVTSILREKKMEAGIKNKIELRMCKKF